MLDTFVAESFDVRDSILFISVEDSSLLVDSLDDSDDPDEEEELSDDISFLWDLLFDFFFFVLRVEELEEDRLADC